MRPQRGVVLTLYPATGKSIRTCTLHSTLREELGISHQNIIAGNAVVLSNL